MEKFDFYSPTRIVFGRDRETEVGSIARELGSRKAMIVYGGQSALRSGLIDRLEKSLTDSGIEAVRFGGVKPNPRLQHAREGVSLAIREKVDLVLGVGGGSSLDTAKAISIGAASPDVDIWDIWMKKTPLERVLPIGAIPTIPAAGSETSDSAVLEDEETAYKRGLRSDMIRPLFAIMNPELALTLPSYQLSCGIVDIMMHTMDRYFNPITENALTDEIAESVLRVTIENGRKALQNRSDYASMSELTWCSSLSHNGLTGLGGLLDFAPHQLGHELSAKFDTAHGASLSVMWPAWAQYCMKTNPSRFIRFGEKVWGLSPDGLSEEEAAAQVIGKTVEYFRALNMPTCFSELNVGVQDEETLKDLALRCSFYETRTIGQFRILRREEMLDIYRLANH